MMPDEITYEWIFSVPRQTGIHSCRATDDAARSAVLSSTLTQQKICLCTVSIGGFIRLFYPQCSDIRTVIYLRTQVFHPSWTFEMRVSRTRYTPELWGTVTYQVNGFHPSSNAQFSCRRTNRRFSYIFYRSQLSVATNVHTLCVWDKWGKSQVSTQLM